MARSLSLLQLDSCGFVLCYVARGALIKMKEWAESENDLTNNIFVIGEFLPHHSIDNIFRIYHYAIVQSFMSKFNIVIYI